MRSFLTAIIVIIGAMLAVCIAILSTLVSQFLQMMHNTGPVSGIGAISGNVGTPTIVISALVGGLCGYLLARLFLTQSSGQ